MSSMFLTGMSGQFLPVGSLVLTSRHHGQLSGIPYSPPLAPLPVFVTSPTNFGARFSRKLLVIGVRVRQTSNTNPAEPSSSKNQPRNTLLRIFSSPHMPQRQRVQQMLSVCRARIMPDEVLGQRDRHRRALAGDHPGDSEGGGKGVFGFVDELWVRSLIRPHRNWKMV